LTVPRVADDIDLYEQTWLGHVLALIHPDGVAARTLVIGSRTLAVQSVTDGDAQCDLIVVAPARTERSAAWLDAACRVAANRLARDGLVYVIASPVCRWRVLRRLRAAGLARPTPVLHLPTVEGSRHLVVLDNATARFAFSYLTATRPWKRRLAVALSGWPGAWRALGAVLPGVGVAVGRPAERPWQQWLFGPGPRAESAGAAVVSTSWRGKAGGMGVVLHRFPHGACQPSAVAKLASHIDRESCGSRESERLMTLGRSAAAAGARVPAYLASADLGGRNVLLETVVSGRSAAALLADAPDRLPSVITRVADWLERWNKATLTNGGAQDWSSLAQALLASAELTLPHGSAGRAYRAWLAGELAYFRSNLGPLVAAHNDLTMDNVMVQCVADLGVVDWEAAERACLPLGDFYFAACSAVLAADACPTWSAAVQASFGQPGLATATFAPLLHRLSLAVGVSPRLSRLSFHATWLRHAADELRLATQTSAVAPFGDVVCWLVNRPSLGWPELEW
jgi:hypothetical protein